MYCTKQLLSQEVPGIEGSTGAASRATVPGKLGRLEDLGSLTIGLPSADPHGWAWGQGTTIRKLQASPSAGRPCNVTLSAQRHVLSHQHASRAAPQRSSYVIQITHRVHRSGLRAGCVSDKSSCSNGNSYRTRAGGPVTCMWAKRSAARSYVTKWIKLCKHGDMHYNYFWPSAGGLHCICSEAPGHRVQWGRYGRLSRSLTRTSTTLRSVHRTRPAWPGQAGRFRSRWCFAIPSPPFPGDSIFVPPLGFRHEDRLEYGSHDRRRQTRL